MDNDFPLNTKQVLTKIKLELKKKQEENDEKRKLELLQQKFQNKR